MLVPMQIAISNIADKFKLKFKRVFMPEVPKWNLLASSCFQIQTRKWKFIQLLLGSLHVSRAITLLKISATHRKSSHSLAVNLKFRYGFNSRRYKKWCQAFRYRSNHFVKLNKCVADDVYRFMGPTGCGKSNVHNVVPHINFSYFIYIWFKRS